MERASRLCQTQKITGLAGGCSNRPDSSCQRKRNDALRRRSIAKINAATTRCETLGSCGITIPGRRAILAAAALAPAAALAQSTAPSDAYLYIIWPNDGQRIKGGFWCRFGLRNMGIARAGDKTENAGHHHLLIDANDALKAL